MKMNRLLTILFFLIFSFPLISQDNNKFLLKEVFDMEYASDPRISSDGKSVVYVRNFMDIMKDRRRSNLWILDTNGSEHRPITSGNSNNYSPRWSPDGKKLLYISNSEHSLQVYIRWMDTGQTAKLTNLTSSPSGIQWSPDGKWIAFSMFVEDTGKSFAQMPAKPSGAEWAPPVKYIDKIKYRSDGGGYAKTGYSHLFLLSADGGTPRQLTSGDFNHGGSFSWSKDSKSIVFSANRHKDWEYEPINSELYRILIGNGEIDPLTTRRGPDHSPAISPQGDKIAYLGFDDQSHGYHVTQLYLMNSDGSAVKALTQDHDRSVSNPQWDAAGKGIYFQYDDKGETKIGYVSLNGKVKTISGKVGGTSIGRPYSGGTYTIAGNGQYAFTYSKSNRPADVAIGSKEGNIKVLTALNEDLFGYKKLGKVEEIWYKSSFDDKDIQGWYITPPEFDPSKKYPMILEIHGGPFANYGPRFSAEMQLYAAAGYVVLYINPRGSSSYGKAFGNLIHHNYPNQDYDDLISGVDTMIKKGYIDEKNLFVTGGSGGGVLSAWIVGKTNRFKAAVVAKPVINWFSFALTADNYNFYYKYWFPGPPWDHLEHYMKRSPISYVGNVKTPTMLLTGEADYRTPISETEQFYQALKLQKVETAMVRIPGASHGIASRPSNLIAKVAYILKWFEKYK